MAVLLYFIRKPFLEHIELGALKIKKEVISEYIYIWRFKTLSNVEKDRSFQVLNGRKLLSFRKLRLS